MDVYTSSEMVLCQYFLKGDCRFGDNCRFEHPSAKKETVCPYFLRGTCRYGDKCRNEHPRDRGSSAFTHGNFRQSNGRAEQWGNSHYSQNRFSALSYSQREQSTDSQQQTVSQIQQTVKNDMETWERSKQWPLSCYAYTKEEPSFLGLLDFSPEEIRLEAYTANAKGNANGYEQGLKQLINQNHKRRLQLSQMTVSEIQEEVKKNATWHHQHGHFPMDAASSVEQTLNRPLRSGGLSSQSSLFGQTIANTVTSGTLLSSSANSSSQSAGISGVNAVSQSSSFGRTFFGSVIEAPSLGINSTVLKPEKDHSSVSAAVNVLADSLTSSKATAPSPVENASKISPHRQASTCSEEDLQAFMADSFVLGKIPECPPPLELC